MAGKQSVFDFSRARPELVESRRVVRSFSSEEALVLEFTEKTLHNRSIPLKFPLEARLTTIYGVVSVYQSRQ